jgi:hypothetical protein
VYQELVVCKPQQRLVIFEGPRPDPWFDNIRQPLVEKLVEGNGYRSWHSRHLPLLELQVEEALGFAEQTVDGLLWYLRVPVSGSRP